MATITDLYKPQELTTEGAIAGIRKYQERYKPKIQLTLSEYIRQAWHVIEPTTKYLHNWHIDVIAEYLQAVDDGSVTRLLLNLPPRYSKSICLSVMWPTWSWINHPDSRWLFASYSSSLSTKHSVDRRTIITSDWYRSRWGTAVELAKDQNEKNEFQNTRRGVMVATSVGGSATGKGGNRIVCVSGKTKIITDLGELYIKEIVENMIDCKVLQLNHFTSELEWDIIEAYEQGNGRNMALLDCGKNGSLDCTRDHPAFVSGDGYIRADAIIPGSELIHAMQLQDLRKDVQQASEGLETNKVWAILQPCLSWCSRTWGGEPRMGRRKSRTFLHHMWETVFSKTRKGGGWKTSVLRKTLYEYLDEREPPEDSSTNGGMLVLRKDNQDYKSHGRKTPILFSGVQECSPLSKNDGKGEQQLFLRDIQGGIFKGIQQTCSSDKGQRQSLLSRLLAHRKRTNREVSGSSYRLQQRQQPREQSNLRMPLVSLDNARKKAVSYCMETAVVKSIAYPSTIPEKVYNLRTRNHNYFANGFLVHNCDDPQNPEEASSDTLRLNVERWFDQTVSTRLDDKVAGAIVVVMQRLHQGDLSQHCIDLGYTHLNLPAVSEGQTIISLPPSSEMEVVREDGELLWPEREDEEGIKRARLGLGEYGFASQYQQRPVPLGGGDFKKEWFNIVDAAPPGLQLCRAWDCAATAGGGDYTVGLLMGRSREGKYYVLSMVRGQWSPAEVEKRIMETARADGPSVPIRQEQEGGSSGKAIIMDFTNKLAGYDYAGEKPTGAKTTRWNPFARQAEAGNVSLIKAWWNKPFLDELSMAPHGRNDDIVDSASGAFNYLALSRRRAPGDAGIS